MAIMHFNLQAFSGNHAFFLMALRALSRSDKLAPLHGFAGLFCISHKPCFVLMALASTVKIRSVSYKWFVSPMNAWISFLFMFCAERK